MKFMCATLYAPPCYLAQRNDCYCI